MYFIWFIRVKKKRNKLLICELNSIVNDTLEMVFDFTIQCDFPWIWRKLFEKMAPNIAFCFVLCCPSWSLHDSIKWISFLIRLYFSISIYFVKTVIVANSFLCHIQEIEFMQISTIKYTYKCPPQSASKWFWKCVFTMWQSLHTKQEQMFNSLTKKETKNAKKLVNRNK